MVAGDEPLRGVLAAAFVLKEPLPVRVPQIRQVIKAGKQPGQVPGHGNTAVLVPLGAFDYHHRVLGVNVAAAQAAGFGRAQARAEDQPEDDRDRVLAERAAVLGADGVGRPEEGGQLVIGEHVRQASDRAGDPCRRHDEPLHPGQLEVLAELTHRAAPEGAPGARRRVPAPRGRQVPGQHRLAGVLRRAEPVETGHRVPHVAQGVSQRGPPVEHRLDLGCEIAGERAHRSPSFVQANSASGRQHCRSCSLARAK